MEAQHRFRKAALLAVGLRLSLPPLRLLALLLLHGCLPSAAAAQSTDPPATSGSPYVLHVYEDLVQIPTLVLNSLQGSYRGLKESNFTLRVDQGPPFHPRHARLEGEDPITLALLLDVRRGSAERTLAQLDRALAQLPANWLTTRDHISIFASDCVLVRSVTDQPYSRDVLLTGMHAALANTMLHGVGDDKGCTASHRLWDSLAGVVSQIGRLPGRRVILVLSDGEDHGSRNTWHELTLYAGRYGVAILGLIPTPDVVPLTLPKDFTPGTRLQVNQEYPFGMVCGGSGGLVLPFTESSLSAQLTRVVDLLRKRYILEFARPGNGTAGMHDLQIVSTDPSATIRATGISFPPPDKSLLTDKNTVPSDPSRAPEIGSRRILTQPH